MRNVLVFAFLALAMAVVAPRFLAHTGAPTATQADVATAAPSAPATSSSSSAYAHSMTIEPGQGGHFSVAAEVDGRHLDFLVDTGASVIALRAQDAGRLGIYPAAREYTVNVATANGVVRGAPVELGLVEVGSLSVRNVTALVLPDEALGQNLLGMSFLSRVRWEHRDGRLVLEQ
ncbi:MAG TPA: TIGR02281 family clan AA aspartic protease [Xanthobacteraceae bacterium]|jgi:aspartyl protease family protein|nr:TIGR02281 family clan AA aspartic protease [Xanthobacteraceae bacterium]